MKRTSRLENWIAVGSAAVLAALLCAFFWFPRPATDYRADVEQQSRTLLEAFMRGDPAALQTLAAPNPTDLLGALTPDGAAAAMGPDAKVTVEPIDTQTRVSPNLAEVHAVLHTSGGDVSVLLKWQRESVDSSWGVEPFALPRVDLSKYPYFRPIFQATFAANGQLVAQPGALSLVRDFPVWPGVSVVKAIADPESGLPPARDTTVRFLGDLTSGDYRGSSFTLDEPGYGPGSEAQVSAAVDAYLKACAEAVPSRQDNCPFAPLPDLGKITRLRKVVFSHPVVTASEHQRNGLLRLEGNISVSAEQLFGGVWKPVKTTTEFKVNGTLHYTAKDGISVRLGSRSEEDVQTLWAASVTDEGAYS